MCENSFRFIIIQYILHELNWSKLLYCERKMFDNRGYTRLLRDV